MLQSKKKISDSVRSEVENVVATVETRICEAILSVLDNLVVPRMELAMRSVSSSSALNPSHVLLDPDRRFSSDDSNGLQITASSGFD